MKKKWLAGILSAVMVFSVTGCGGGGGFQDVVRREGEFVSAFNGEALARVHYMYLCF